MAIYNILKELGLLVFSTTVVVNASLIFFCFLSEVFNTEAASRIVLHPRQNMAILVLSKSNIFNFHQICIKIN